MEEDPDRQGPLKCYEKFLNNLLCASNDPNGKKKTWGRKCIDCLKPTTEDERPPEEQQQTPQRESWGNRFTFFITTLGMSVGLGQVWRFPTLSYRHGGGSFLIMYGILIFLFGNGLFFFEISNGQYTGKNPLRVYDKVPFFIGTGWSMIAYSYFFCTYYSHMVAFSIYYIFRTMAARTPWSFCQEDGEADSYRCVPYPKNRNPTMDGVVCGNEGFIFNHSQLCEDSSFARKQQLQCCSLLKVPEADCNSSHFSIEELCRPREFASAYFWSHVVNRVYREDDSNYGYLGNFNFAILGCSFLSWILAYMVLYKGIKSMGVLMYIMVPLPYIILLIMLGVVTPQSGATDGLIAFFTPNAYSFLDISQWRIAAEQAFYSVGVGMGPLITFGSYSRFDSPSHIDGFLICFCIFMTSVLCSAVVFSVLGMLAEKTGRAFQEVVQIGPGLVFIVYPESLELLPGAQFFAFLFYLMLINLGLSSVTGIIETVSSAAFDIWPKTRHKKYLVNLVVIFSAFLLGMPITLRGGLVIYNSFDTFSAGLPLIPICILEMTIVVFIYGLGRFCEDISFMLGFYPNRYYRYQWLAGPFILTAIFIYGVASIELNERLWSKILDGILVLVVLGWIPTGMIYTTVIYRKKKKTFKDMFRPPEDHGPKNPADREAREQYSVFRKIF